MGKIGVGIGDDFPIDDGRPPESGGPQNEPDWEKRREEWRRQRDEWREKSRQWREEWRKRKREFRAEMRARYGDHYDDHDHERWHYGPHHWLRLVAVLGLVAVTIMIFSHIYLLFGLIVLAGLYFAYRGGFDHFEFPHHHTGPAPGPRPPAPPSDAPKA